MARASPWDAEVIQCISPKMSSAYQVIHSFGMCDEWECEVLMIHLITSQHFTTCRMSHMIKFSFNVRQWKFYVLIIFIYAPIAFVNCLVFTCAATSMIKWYARCPTRSVGSWYVVITFCHVKSFQIKIINLKNCSLITINTNRILLMCLIHMFCGYKCEYKYWKIFYSL